MHDALPDAGLAFTVLGSGTSIPSASRGPAGFLVHAAARTWLVDGGSGTLGRCIAVGVDPQDLAGGIYSHAHPDHMADLVPLLFSFRVRSRQAPYPVHAARKLGEVLEGLRRTFGHWIDAPAVVDLIELPTEGEGIAELGGLRLRTRPANHSGGALHLRFENEHGSVVFSGDTGPSDALVELARGADLLVCECAGSDDEPVPGHLWPAAVRDLVQQAHPREVWLTHLYPHVDPVRAVAKVSEVGVPTRHASDLDRWSVT